MSAKDSLRLVQRPPLTNVKARLRLLSKELRQDIDTVIVVVRTTDEAIGRYCYENLRNMDEVYGLQTRSLTCDLSGWRGDDDSPLTVPDKSAS